MKKLKLEVSREEIKQRFEMLRNCEITSKQIHKMFTIKDIRKVLTRKLWYNKLFAKIKSILNSLYSI
jgi:hypothetical protein